MLRITLALALVVLTVLRETTLELGLCGRELALQLL
jgi:hypothetical protein